MHLLMTTLQCRADIAQQQRCKISSWSLFSAQWTRTWCGSSVASSQVNSLAALNLLTERKNNATRVSSMLRFKTSCVLITARMAALEQKTQLMRSVHPLTLRLVCSLTWIGSWCGDDAETLLAVMRLCSYTALDGLRRHLRYRLRPANGNFASSTLLALQSLRRCPTSSATRRQAEDAIRTLCYGPCLHTAHLRVDLVSAVCADRSTNPNDCHACMQDALWTLEKKCASYGLVDTAPPDVLAPLLALLLVLSVNDDAPSKRDTCRLNNLRKLCSRHISNMSDKLAMSPATLARCAAEPVIQKELLSYDLDYQLRVPALERVLSGGVYEQGRVSDELQYLKQLGAPVPRHAHVLIAGERLTALALGEVREDVKRSLQNSALRLRGLLLEQLVQCTRFGTAPPLANLHGAVRNSSATKQLRTLSLAAEAALERAQKEGPWNFSACLSRIVPCIKHQPIAGSRDDDPRPRPLPLLSLPTETVHDDGEWLITFFRRNMYRGIVQVRCMPARIRCSYIEALNADGSRVSKSWAPICLHPHLEEPADVPHSGPTNKNRPALGLSRYFSWVPLQPEDHFIHEDLTQMEAMIETLEPQEYWIQYTGVLKKDAVQATKYLHQREGHLAGRAKLSAFCSLCSTDSQPVAALWCACPSPKRARVRQIIRERWHLPASYLATPAWRSGRETAGLPCKTRYLQFAGPCWLPNPPPYPPRSALSRLQKMTRSACNNDKRACEGSVVACAGAWWNCGIQCKEPLDTDTLYLQPGETALVQLTPTDATSSLLRRRPLDWRYRRCDAVRLMFNLSKDTVLYDLTTRYSREMLKAPDSLVLQELPTSVEEFCTMYGSTGASEARMAVCTGTSSAQPAPPCPPHSRGDATLNQRLFSYKSATAFEKHLLCLPPREILFEKRHATGSDYWVPCEKRAKTSTRGVLAVRPRAGLRTVGFRRVTKFCWPCKLWQDEQAESCSSCGHSVRENPCRRCGSNGRIAVTTTHGAAAWACGRCCTLEGMEADEGLRHNVFHADDAGRVQLDCARSQRSKASYARSAVCLSMSSMHPALSAAWAHAVETILASPAHWVRSAHDGQTLDTNLSHIALQRLLAKWCTARLKHLGKQQTETYIYRADKKLLKSLAVLHVSQDWHAAANLLGMTHALGGGSLLQQLIAPHSFGESTSNSLQCCARRSGGPVIL